MNSSAKTPALVDLSCQALLERVYKGLYEAQGETERASSLKFSKRLRRVHPVPEGLPPCSLPRGGLTSDGGQWAGQWGDPHSTLKWRAARGTFWKY